MVTLILAAATLAGQGETGRSIGKVSVQGKIIVIELNRDVLGRQNLFNLQGRTLRFLPAGSAYRIENTKLKWEADTGDKLDAPRVTLKRFAFPFSERTWTRLRVGNSGSIVFDASDGPVPIDPYFKPDGGVILGRFDELTSAARALPSKAPAICAFLKPRLYGPRYVKEFPDRLVVTWDLTEPYGGLMDFSWSRTENRFQATLHRNGVIEMSYQRMAARDGIVGIYPSVRAKGPVHFSSLTRRDGPFTNPYEAFHYLRPPRPQDLSSTVIQALGDKFDFLAYYSDCRFDQQEASPPSDGPIGDAVRGIGDTQQQLSPASRGSGGRFQHGFALPVYVGSNEMQEAPPRNVSRGSATDITTYLSKIRKESLPYNYAVGHLGHEICHRWSAYVVAKVDGQVISLGPWPHWDPGLHTPVAYPYSLPLEASTMGGGVWRDNQDGTFTLLRYGYIVPAPGFSHLDLYLMGLLSAKEVPDFFLLKRMTRIGKDQSGNPIYKADRLKVTIQDVIAANGPRVPDSDHAQKSFTTGIVAVVEHGRSPSKEILTRANGIRKQWISYWRTVTGGRSTMTVEPKD